MVWYHAIEAKVSHAALPYFHSRNHEKLTDRHQGRVDRLTDTENEVAEGLVFAMPDSSRRGR
jgi:hypothetical protein